MYIFRCRFIKGCTSVWLIMPHISSITCIYVYNKVVRKIHFASSGCTRLRTIFAYNVTHMVTIKRQAIHINNTKFVSWYNLFKNPSKWQILSYSITRQISTTSIISAIFGTFKYTSSILAQICRIA